MSKISFLLVQKFFLQSITRAHMKPPTKAAPVEKEEEEIVEIPVTVGIPPSGCCGSGIRCFFYPLKLGSGSGIWDGKIRIPDHISESLKTIFELKIRKFFDAHQGFRFRNGKIRIGDPGTNIPNSQHCRLLSYYCFVLSSFLSNTVPDRISTSRNILFRSMSSVVVPN
jgi:hypothetical protein